LTLPFYGVAGSGLPLTLTFSSSNGNASNYCVTGMQIFGYNTASFGRAVVDPSGLSHYYPFTSGTMNNYASGVGNGVADVTSSGVSVITSGTTLLNNQAVLNISNTGFMNSNTNVVYGANGMTFAGWFYNSGVYGLDTSMIVLSGTSTLALKYKTNNSIGLSTNGGVSLQSGIVYPNAWNHLCVSVVNGSYVMYVNGWLVGSVSGTNLGLGNYLVGVGGGGFVGNVTDIRVYGRVLSSVEVRSVWNLGVAASVMGEVIDTYGMIMRYSFDYGSVI
jgi:Concanavalin A-like lectin/glucanases superfamily